MWLKPIKFEILKQSFVSISLRFILNFLEIKIDFISLFMQPKKKVKVDPYLMKTLTEFKEENGPVVVG